MNAIISPARVDPFENGGATPDVNSRGYSQIMREQLLRKDQADLEKQMKDKAKDGSLKVSPVVIHCVTCITERASISILLTN